MENYEKCKHVQSVGTYAVYVDPGCPEAHKIKGVLVSSRQRCERCQNRSVGKYGWKSSER